MKSISAVEYTSNGNIIRSTTQIEMEQAIITENTQWFQLTRIALVFYRDIILIIGSCIQNNLVQSIISNNAELQYNNDELNQFVKLLYKQNQLEIDIKIEVD